MIREARAYLRSEVEPDDMLDVVALGSLARLEAGPESDFDYLLVAHGLPSDPRLSRELLGAVERLRTEKLRLAEPRATQMFGRVVSAPDLTERIGLEDDTNRTHSHRVLLLEESRSIYRPDLHGKLILRIVERYLHDYGDPSHPIARFLLNDVLRYWRTLTVDYQAKRWERLGREWGLRFLKLVITRKLTFAGTLSSIFLCDRPTVDSLTEELQKPPLARLASAYSSLEPQLQEKLGEVLRIADRFLGLVQDSTFRSEANSVRDRSEIVEGSRFDTA